MTIAEKILAEDRVWNTLSSFLVGRATRTSSRGFSFFNCPMCPQMGQHRHDTKQRCGVIYDGDGIGIHCFNCGLKLRYKRGTMLSKGMEAFLLSLGVPESKVKELYFWAWEIQRILGSSSFENSGAVPSFFHSGFPTVNLPEKSKPVVELAGSGCDDEDFLDVINYLMTRGDDLQDATDYHWTPSTKNNMNRRIIVPFYYEGRVVGWTGRAVDDSKPKYFNKSPQGYLFNCDTMKKNRKYIILTEGIFDALAIEGVGLQSNDLDENKISWINSKKQTKILVPDRDRSGDKLVDIALEQGWDIAFPRGASSSDQWWDDDIKDIADAVKRYGRLWTLRSVISTATKNKVSIAMGRLQLKSAQRNYSFE